MKLPDGWIEAELQDLALVIRGISFPSTAHSSVPTKGSVVCLRTANVQHAVDWSDLWYVPEEFVKREEQFLLDGDVLISVSNSRELVGKVCPVRHLASPATLGAFISAIRASTGVDPLFLYHQLAAGMVQTRFRALASTTTNIANLSSSKLSRIELRLAPLPEQRRIVGKMEELFSELDAGVAALERAQAKLERYRASVLKAAVEGKLTERWRRENPSKESGEELLRRILAERRRRWGEEQLAKCEAKGRKLPKKWKEKYKEPAAPDTSELPELPDGWCWATVEQLTAGNRSSAYGVLKPGPDIPSGVRLVRVGNINDGRVDGPFKRVSPSIVQRYARTTLRGGEILITLVGAIGRTAVVPDWLAGANTARAVGVIPVSTLVNPHWIELWFRNPTQLHQMVGKAHEVARKTLNLEDVRSTPVAIPPLPEQDAVVASVDAKRESVAPVSAAVAESLRSSDALRQAILKTAFEGRLVLQDSNDEPASVLVERIRRGREGNHPKKRRGRKSKADRQTLDL